VRRGAVYHHPRFPERRYVVVAAPEVATLGTVILADIDAVAPAGAGGLLAVTLTDDDPVSGAVMVHHLSYFSVSRLGDCFGHLSPETMDAVDYALRSALALGY
jgi:mRNA-degrading endonuclease toxin of MazEF toxin-antitoxin module